MTIITSGVHPKEHWPGVAAIWGQTYNEHMEEFSDLFDQYESDKSYEVGVEHTGFGLAPIKPEGQAAAYDGDLQGAISTYVHVAYALGYIVTYEELRDNKYPEIAPRRAAANAFSMRQTIETLAAFLYNNAFSTTYFTTGDGAALCSASHVNPTGGTYSNILSPGADLSEQALEDMLTQLMGFTNARGLNINVMPRSLHVHRAEWFDANRILKSILQNDSANNAINALKATNAIPEGIKLNHYFSTAGTWFVRTNIKDGMKMYWRDRPMLDKDNDFDTKNAKALSYMRLSLGADDPRAIMGSAAP